MQTVAGLVILRRIESNFRTGCRIGEGDLNIKLLIAWMKRLNCGMG